MFFSIPNIHAADSEIQKPIERAKLFRKYLLELVNAAIPPFRTNTEIMERGSECIPIIEEDEKVISIDLFLAIMSIGKDNYRDLHILRQAEDISELDIKPGLMKNIHKIMRVFQSPSKRFRHDPVNEVLRQYVLRHKEDSSAAGTSKYEECLRSALRCFKSMISIYHADNKEFLDLMMKSFKIVGGLIQDDDDDEDLEDDSRWDELDKIIEELPKLSLTTPDSDYVQRELDVFVENLNENNHENSDSET